MGNERIENAKTRRGRKRERGKGGPVGSFRLFGPFRVLNPVVAWPAFCTAPRSGAKDPAEAGGKPSGGGREPQMTASETEPAPPRRRPDNLTYAVDDRPPPGKLAL